MKMHNPKKSSVFPETTISAPQKDQLPQKLKLQIIL